ncbi:MAG: permease prefix domain 1-containing protein [Bacillota bacterium]
MQGRLRSYIEELLAGLDESEELQEFKYELVMNLGDKIDDLRSDGLTEEEAFREAVATLGDLRAVFAERQAEGVLMDVAADCRGVPSVDAFIPPTQQVRGSKSVRQGKSGDRDYTGALVMFSIAAYLIMGLVGVAGGFKVWWVIPLAGIGLGQLMAKEYPGAIVMLTLAFSCLLVMLRVLSSWWWVLALLTLGIGAIVLIEG